MEYDTLVYDPSLYSSTIPVLDDTQDATLYAVAHCSGMSPSNVVVFTAGKKKTLQPPSLFTNVGMATGVHQLSRSASSVFHEADVYVQRSSRVVQTAFFVFVGASPLGYYRGALTLLP